MNDAQKAAIDALAKKKKLTAERLLAAAADPSHPCHDYYEWDDSVAGHQHRLGQSRQLICTYHVIVSGGDTVKVKTRKYIHSTSQARYLDGDEALKSFRDELEDGMRKDVRSLVLKHRRLGLESMVSAVQDAWAVD